MEGNGYGYELPFILKIGNYLHLIQKQGWIWGVNIAQFIKWAKNGGQEQTENNGFGIKKGVFLCLMPQKKGGRMLIFRSNILFLREKNRPEN